MFDEIYFQTNIDSVFYETGRSSGFFIMFDQNDEFTLRSEKWYQIRHAAYEAQIAELFGLLRSFKIEPILIKGWAAGQLYPQPYTRYFSDIDLAVDPIVYKCASEILKIHTDIFVDLHCGLRHLDTVDWDLLFERSRLVNCGESTIRILSEEDHLRVLAVHWLQDGGAYKHRLQDIYYAVSRRSKKFDWSKCLDSIEFKRKQWIVIVIGLAAKYLDLDVSTLPFNKEAMNMPRWVLNTIEKEWKSDTRLQPLKQTFKSPKRFFQQLRKRLNPNPLQAMIDVNGAIEGTPIIFFKVGSICLRTISSLNKVVKKIKEFCHSKK